MLPAQATGSTLTFQNLIILDFLQDFLATEGATRFGILSTYQKISKMNKSEQKIKINITHSPSTGLRLHSKFACGFLLMLSIGFSIQY